MGGIPPFYLYLQPKHADSSAVCTAVASVLLMLPANKGKTGFYKKRSAKHAVFRFSLHLYDKN